MRAFSFRLPSGGGLFGRRPQQLRSRRQRTFSSSEAATSQSVQQSHLEGVFKSALTSGSLALAGDVLAQLLTSRGKSDASYDAARAGRMFTFGFTFYGPYQYWWYRTLDRAFPARTVANFAAKVSLNQLCLAPLTITMAFGINLALQRRLGELPSKLQADFVPTMLNGWRFWVPAASVNFTLVPLRYQVLYMSCCGCLWTAYLSYSSSKRAST